MRWRATNGCAGFEYSTRWVGTLLACRRKTRRSRNKRDPGEWTKFNIEEMKRQHRRFGFSYDWSTEISSCDPEYYRWNQWFFLKMHERGLAYRKKALVNWCNECQTVLANEQVVDGLLLAT